jgi:hypothetical protein
MSEEFKNRLERAKAQRRENIAKFRAEHVKEMPDPLPDSGLRIFLRDASMMDLVFSGRLPEALLDVFKEMTDSGGKDFDLKAMARNGAEFSQMVDGLVMAAVIEPPIAEKGDDDHLGINELSADDRMAIFEWLNREKNDLHSFRGEQDEPVSTAQPGIGVQPETQPDPAAGNGNRRVGAGRSLPDGGKARGKQPGAG